MNMGLIWLPLLALVFFIDPSSINWVCRCEVPRMFMWGVQEGGGWQKREERSVLLFLFCTPGWGSPSPLVSSHQATQHFHLARFQIRCCLWSVEWGGQANTGEVYWCGAVGDLGLLGETMKSFLNLPQKAYTTRQPDKLFMQRTS